MSSPNLKPEVTANDRHLLTQIAKGENISFIIAFSASSEILQSLNNLFLFLKIAWIYYYIIHKLCNIVQEKGNILILNSDYPVNFGSWLKQKKLTF